MMDNTLQDTLDTIEQSVDNDFYRDLMNYIITNDEMELLNMLGECFNAFCHLPILHTADKPEFAKAIHEAQNIVLARVGLRQTGITDR